MEATITRRKLDLFAKAGGQMSLVVERYIEAPLYADLLAKAATYFAKTVNIFGGDPVKMPCNTPNGLISPKQETLEEFNEIERLLPYLAKEIFLQEPTHIRLPGIIRIKGAQGDEANRGYATNKPHTDVWAGDPENSYVVVIPLLGDVTNNGLRFGEPEKVSDSFNKEQKDYEEGLKTVSGIKWYGMKMRPQHAYIIDSWCLHHTLRESSFPEAFRVSLDFRVTFGKPSKARYSHLYSEEAHITTAAETVQETLQKYGNNNVCRVKNGNSIMAAS